MRANSCLNPVVKGDEQQLHAESYCQKATLLAQRHFATLANAIVSIGLYAQWHSLCEPKALASGFFDRNVYEIATLG